MKYLLLICWDESRQLNAAESEAMARDTTAWVTEMDGRKVRLTGDRLRPAAEAHSVRVRNGKASVTEGPFAETNEQLVGFDIIDCSGLDEAIEIASKHPVARYGTVEVHAFWVG